MWHVDEGALHAYLDGALDALPASEAARVREHIASCPACQSRLEEERALRADAEAILSGAAPPVGPPPPFEELRAIAVARARRRTGPGTRLVRLSWAASLVMAVGAGWLLRGSQGWRFTEGGDVPSVTTQVSGGGVPAGAGAGAGAPGAGAAEAGGEDGAGTTGAERVADAAPIPAASVPAPTSAAKEPAPSVVPGAEAPRVAQSEAPTAPPPAPAGDAAEARRSLEASRERVAAMVSAERPQPTEDLRARGEVLGVAAAGAARAPAGEAPASVMVPGLQVLEVTRADASLPDGTLRVLQRLDRDTLELLHLPEGSAPPSGDGALPDGRVQTSVPLGGGWLVGRARVTPERLRALLSLVPGVGGDA